MNRLLSSFWFSVTGGVTFAVVGVITLVMGSQLNNEPVQIAGWALIGVSVILLIGGLGSATFRAGGRFR